VTCQVTVALIVAPALGTCQSTPQSGGTSGPVVGILAGEYREPFGPHPAEYGVPAVLVAMVVLTGTASTVTVSVPRVAETHTSLGEFVQAKVARLTQPWPAGLVVTCGAGINMWL
jgi:Flp pilus assembly pilin Flp